MLTQILSHTPLWVWALLLALVYLGVNQLLPRVTRQGRVLRLALGMTAFSLVGTVSSFPSSAAALAGWLVAALMVAWMTLQIRLPEQTRYLPQRRAFHVPGSWVPLALMLGVFVVKYAAGVLLGMHATLTQGALFAPLLGMVYGAFSGAFVGRAARLLRLARQTPGLAKLPG
jgi:hypothetical protein